MILFFSCCNTFHWKLLFLRVFCWYMYLISYAQGILACQRLAWLSSIIKRLALRSHGHMWSVYRAGGMCAFCIWYARLYFKYDCDVMIPIFNHVECRIDKWHITMTSHTCHGISTHWQLYSLFSSSFRQTRKKISSRPFVRGTTGDGIPSHWTSKAPLQWCLASQ